MKKAIIMSILLTATEVLSENKQISFFDLVNKAKTNYVKFQKHCQDLTISQQITTFLGKKKLNCDIFFFKKGKKWRLEQTIAFETLKEKESIVFIGDGKDTWMITKEGQRKLSKEEAFSVEKPITNWWDIIEEGKIINEEKVNDHDCYVIEPTKKSLPIKRMWIDKKDYILIKMTGREQGKNLTWHYSNFKDIGEGFILPHKTEVYVNDKILSITLLKSIEINQGLKDEIFIAKRENLPTLFDLLKEKVKKGGD